jgi:adenosyl cobinamide kinase/adenosyl cobinamide phosphate guanylyltransferase
VRNQARAKALQHVLTLSAYVGLGMTPADIAALYREYAAKCLIVAQRLENSAERVALVDMAQAWVALADQAEKNQALPIVYETPPSLSIERRS